MIGAPQPKHGFGATEPEVSILFPSSDIPDYHAMRYAEICVSANIPVRFKAPLDNLADAGDLSRHWRCKAYPDNLGEGVIEANCRIESQVAKNELVLDLRLNKASEAIRRTLQCVVDLSHLRNDDELKKGWKENLREMDGVSG